MAKNVLYAHCRLSKKTATGVVVDVAWIPYTFAKIGKYLKIKDDNGWRADEVGSVLPEDYVVEHERDYKIQRKGSDVAKGTKEAL